MASRFEREIEEIVSKAELPKPRQLRRFSWRPHWNAGSGRLRRLAAPTTVGLIGIVLLIVGLVRGSGVITFVGIGVMLAAYLISIFRTGRSFEETTGYDRSWRGRSLDAPQPRPRRWFGKRR